MPKVKNSQRYYYLTLPFPPELSVDDLLEKSRCNNKPGKIPNCFLCYRISWVEHLKKAGMKLDLSEISGFVSCKWRDERQEVKDFYKKLSCDAKKKHRANNKSRVFIFHNQCDLNNTEKNQDEVVSLGSSPSEIGNPLGTGFISIPCESPPFASPTQFNNTNFSTDWYSPIDTTNSISTNDPNYSLKDIMIELNLVISPENYRKFHFTNFTTEIAPEELERVKRFHDHVRSLMSEKKTTTFNHFSVLNEKMNELESNFNSNPQENYDFDPSRGISQDLSSFNNGIEGYTQSVYQPMHDLLTPLDSTSAIEYPNFSADNLSFMEPFNYPYSYNYPLDRNKGLEEKEKMLLEARSERKKLEDKFRHIQEIIKTIRELIFGNKL